MLAKKHRHWAKNAPNRQNTTGMLLRKILKPMFLLVFINGTVCAERVALP
jgi:hypothetical protein